VDKFDAHSADFEALLRQISFDRDAVYQAAPASPAP
jgi:hypothetical protein